MMLLVAKKSVASGLGFTRRAAALAIGLVLTAFIARGFLTASEFAMPPTEDSVTSRHHPVAAATEWRLTGVGSCTTSGCHGGGRPDRIVGSEYNIWIAEDPHARAYSTLYDERSLRMVRLLDEAAAGFARCAAPGCPLPGLPFDDACRAHGLAARGCQRRRRLRIVPWAGRGLAWRITFNASLRRPSESSLGCGIQTASSCARKICAGCHVGGPGSRGESRSDRRRTSAAAVRNGRLPGRSCPSIGLDRKRSQRP